MSPLDQDFYTKPELAELLKISLRTLGRIIASGALETVMVGGQVRIRREAVEAYLEQNKR